MKISIVIPVFNENESLPDLKVELDKNLSAYPDWEVIFVDDGSSDGSTEYLADLCAQDSHYKLIQFYRNYGKSAALSEGFKLADGDYIITMDADLQDDPAEISNLVGKLEEGWDLVSGWKKIRHDPIGKTLPSKLFNFITRVMTGVKIHDFNCGLKGYKKSVVKSIEVFGGRHRYIPALAGQRKFTITEITVNHRARQFGETKYGGSRLFHGFFDLITILFLNRYDQQPLHLFGFFGLISLHLGLIVECVVLYYKYGLGEPFAKHMALLMFGIMLIVIGIQFFSMGLLGELMARTAQGQENRIRKITHTG
ncbi:MAG: glycosyltransferase [Candidatus Marinimicrobia bacterium]|jgi:glycosyltransferase involved in cell wall biosynthesis|nr:glycosyltransferase [Candidatus Neomarinimicrobiota bacterium]MDP6820353.1 glycosyltransferase [Candidatus Neomarinimicrobiota bacterium]MDP7273727.1 glycosyltransferase [Candidatus Neomarinimicrobiota bacterium]HJM33304.1 glycosyltransferase [Candidatus Neomarinimicrobiota bacterium]HJM95650.1 glycosyltransferase [Candidatus Neomarinimicrobiota bacterium]|tara:strand:- start:269 stop:1198 length:930 start_codon:yes stop_codon:yes gene_type:complete